MKTIKDILRLNLAEDIKNVIDLEDESETGIQQEIESYIVTDNIAKHFYDFVTQYTSTIKETGVWISGFYGSGKSYFGKTLGYLIANKTINGTPVRDRFAPRLAGIKDESLIINGINKLDAFPTKVVLLDVAKQNTRQGLAFTLFANFLKSLGFLPNIYGFFEYQLFLEGDLDAFEQRVLASELEPWKEVKKRSMKVPAVVKRVLVGWKYSADVDYDLTHKYLESQIDNFSPVALKDELTSYLGKFPAESIVFIFDEASEAIAQKKFSLLDLEGISEALSSISKKVWTIAIAQEKLDDVINNNNISKSQLIKVTDRFKTKIHLESTEVDKIIRSRLLQKTDAGKQALLDYYAKNQGLIADSTNLDSSFPTKTENAEAFAIYYPFHQYHFALLQNFLFSSKALTSTQIAARGMIITTFDVLRKQLKDLDLYQFGTAHHLTTEAQTQPSAALVNKYDNAYKILHNKDSEIDGTKLLKTIHFINESQRVNPTSENITKLYLSDLTRYHSTKPQIEEALTVLVDAKILLESHHQYKITSDLETRLLEEMREFPVELYLKKREIIQYLKKNADLRTVQTLQEGQTTYNFRILSDQDEDIFPASSKQMKLQVYNIYNINEKLDDFIEKLKLQSQSQKNVIYLVPNTTLFATIDKLLEAVKRHKYTVDKYENDNDPNVRQIAREFGVIKEQKEKELIQTIEKAYTTGHLVYLFDDHLINTDSFRLTLIGIQKKLIKYIFTRRLDVQLSEAAAPKLLKETNKDRYHSQFAGNDFKFFDANGNFIGESLKVVEELNHLIQHNFTDGATIETELLNPPTGYSYGTVCTTLAVLMKAGKLVVKVGGHEYFSPTDPEVLKAFENSREFKKTSFKAISKSLSTADKNEIVRTLMELKYNEEIKNHNDPRVDWNLNDFQLVNASVLTASHFISKIKGMEQSNAEFPKLFPNVAALKTELNAFTGQVNENNYIGKAATFISQKARFSEISKIIDKTQKFIKNNLVKAKGMKRFVDDLSVELHKAQVSDVDFDTPIQIFRDIYDNYLVDRFVDLQQTAQTIKDQYYKLVEAENKKMRPVYQAVKTKAVDTLTEIRKYPLNLNQLILTKAEATLKQAQDRIYDRVSLEFHISCQNSHLSLSEMQNAVALASSKEAELDNLLTQIKTHADPVPNPSRSYPVDEPPAPKLTRKVRLTIPKTVMTVQAYRQILSEQIKALVGVPNEDTIEIDFHN
ncbi:BREX system P-loop protein BrxC [Larkinella sp. C7]|uniref:BREX system P-loop protein BrxC n=1 Tax=Larkinella sp. C7 TaxID=2576607 RepID=UPI00111104B1|nr:BREX system P-loop protein BrxC [Larkinella sp. C7]